MAESLTRLSARRFAVAEQIQLSVSVDTAKATGDIKKFGTTTKTEMQSVQSTTTTSLSSMSASTQTMGQRMAGAGAAISAANASLQLMGRQGPPALQTLAAGAASVAVSGFGPLSVAIVGVTTALSLFMSTAREDGPSILEKRVESLSESLRRLRVELKAAEAGLPTEQQQLVSLISQRGPQIAGLEASQREFAAEIESLRRVRNVLQGSERTEATDRIVDLTQRINDIQDTLTPLRTELQQAEQLLALMRRKQQVDGQIAARAATAATASRGGAPYIPGYGPFPGVSEDDAVARALAFAGIQSPEQIRAARGNTAAFRSLFGAGATGADFITEVDAQARADAERNALAERLRLEREGFTFARHWGLDGVSSPSGSAISQDALGRANLVANNLASSFSQALITQDYSGVGRAMALSFVDQVLQAIAAGAIQATGLQGAVAYGFQSLGSVFGGGTSEVGAEAVG